MSENNTSFFSYVSRTLLVATFITLSACAPGSNNDSEEKLPDDTTQEKVVSSSEEDTNVLEEIIEQEEAAKNDLSASATILAKYNYVDPQRLVPTKALSNALIYFDQNKSRFSNTRYVTVIDFSKSSREKRFHIINMSTGVVWSLRTAHGKGSDSNHDGYAEKFSNVSGSHASSLGAYRTAETYYGSNGYSLRLDGLSSTNSRARSRAVVIHGANYVQERSVIQGRSWGCPALAQEYKTTVINYLKGGSLIWAALN